MNENELLYGLLVGILPYQIESEKFACTCKIFRVTAIFWSLAIYHGCYGELIWVFRVPIIERLRSVVIVIITQLRDKPSIN